MSSSLWLPTSRRCRLDWWQWAPYRDWRRERFFGLVRPDDPLKPHAGVLRRFAITNPEFTRPPLIKLDQIAPDDYYSRPTAMQAARYADSSTSPDCQ